jgi:hypothetical protein
LCHWIPYTSALQIDHHIDTSNNKPKSRDNVSICPVYNVLQLRGGSRAPASAAATNDAQAPDRFAGQLLLTSSQSLV